MLKQITSLAVCTLISLTAAAQDTSSDNLKGYRCISNGFRLPLKWNKATYPRIISRFRRKAMVDLKGKLKLVLPVFYMSNDKPIREVPFPNNVEIQAGIEPSYKMDSKNLDSSPRIVGETVTYHKGDKDSYKIITVDLGNKVIKKGDWFGIWVALENLDGEKMVPMSRLIGNSQEQIFETSYTSEKTSFIKNDFIRTAKKIRTVPPNRNWVMGYSPIAILAQTDYTGDVWGIVGSSIPEGYYDTHGNQYGDENANLGYADKFLSTKLGAPSVNVSKGSDKFRYCAEELKGRLDILKICNVNKVHVALGGNDISGRIKLQQIKKDCIKITKMLKGIDPAIKVIGSTILPHSKSTDKFQTLKNQTPTYENKGKNSTRGRWNGLLRTNPKEAGLDGVHELCSYVEYDWENSASLWSDRDGAPGKFTSDGTHPIWAGSTAIAEHAYLIGSKREGTDSTDKK